MRVYIAAPWVRREEAIEEGKKFEAAGHTVTSRWFYHESAGGDPKDPTGAGAPIKRLQDQATEDIYDVLTSDALVVLNLERSEGKAVETGVAMASGVPVISVGKRGNIFLTLCTEVETVEEAIEALKG